MSSEIKLTDFHLSKPRTYAFLVNLSSQLEKLGKIINFEAVENISEDIIDLLGRYVVGNTITYGVKDKVLCSVTLTLQMTFVDQIYKIIDILSREGTTITDTFDNVLKVFGLKLVSVQCVIPEYSNFLSPTRIVDFAQFIIDQNMFVSSDPTLKISVAFDTAAAAIEEAEAAAAAAKAERKPTYVFLDDVKTKTQIKPKDPQKIQEINEDIVAILDSYVDEIQYEVFGNSCDVKLSLKMNFIHKLGIVFERLKNIDTNIKETFNIALQVFGLTLRSVTCVIPKESNDFTFSDPLIAQFVSLITLQEINVLYDRKVYISGRIHNLLSSPVVGGKKKKKSIKKKVKSRKYIYIKRKRSTRKK